MCHLMPRCTAKRLPLPRGHDLGQSGDGRVIVTCDRAVGAHQAYAGGWILHADRPDEPIRLDPGADIGWIAVSPDGRWVVTSVHGSGECKIWDARDGRMDKKLAEWGAGTPRFSSDGRWLSTDLDGGRLVAVGTWEPGPRVGGIGTFSPDDKLVAIPAGGAIRLVDPATGLDLTALEDPNLDSVGSLAFTSDGTRLIGLSNGKVKGVRVWDLRLVRRHLAEMGLDWDAPPYPPAAAERTARPPKLQVLLGDLRKPLRAREEEARQAIERYRRAVKANPDDARACNNLAWYYATAPESLRDVQAAMPLAENAVRLDPASATNGNTLGVAYYRAGRYREAIGVLRPNLDRQKEQYLAFELYFLAMSHHRLGEPARARDYYDWAVRWPRTHPLLTANDLEDLDLFRAEASELLGVAIKGGAELAPPPRAKQ